MRNKSDGIRVSLFSAYDKESIRTCIAQPNRLIINILT